MFGTAIFQGRKSSASMSTQRAADLLETGCQSRSGRRKTPASSTAFVPNIHRPLLLMMDPIWLITIVFSFKYLFPMLLPGGVYVVEDMEFTPSETAG
jgi:hypothetical protein